MDFCKIDLANYVVDSSNPTIILFCIKSTKILMIYVNGRRFNAQTFISAKFCMWIIRMENLELMEAYAPKRLPFI